MAGQRIGPYEVLGELGRGAVGVVFRARGPDGRVVALKAVPPTQSATGRFERERRLQSELGEEDGFVPLLDAGDFAHGSWIAMPLLEGGTLRDRLHKGPLEIKDALALGVRLARALGAAHARGIVHRDMKPENVLFTTHRGAEEAGGADSEAGGALIADLGLAKHFALELTKGFTRTGELRGTPAYAAPEQLADAKNVTAGADVYGLAAVLHECLTGRTPYEAPNLVLLLEALDKERDSTVGDLREGLPPGVVACIEAALDRDPAARPSMEEIERALEAGLSWGGEPAPSRARPLIFLAGALVVLGGAATGVALRARPPVAPAPSGGPDSEVAPTASASATVPPGDPGTPDPTPVEEAPAPVGSATRGPSRAEQRKALDALTERLRASPDDAALYAERAKTRRALGETKGALEDMDAVVRLSPLDARARSVRGMFKLSRRDRDGALADLEEALRLAPDDRSVQLDHATVLVGRLDRARAFRELDRYLAAGDDAKAWHQRGLNHPPSDYAKAVVDFTRALDLEPRVADTWLQRGIAKAGSADLEGALKDYAEALRLDPRLAYAYSQRGRLRSHLGDLEGALADFDGAVKVDPSSTNHALRGLARHMLGDDKGALVDAEASVKREKTTEALVFRAAVRDSLLDHKRALEDFDAAVLLEPKNGDLFWARGRSKALEGDRLGALADLEAALERDPEHEYLPIWIAALGGDASHLATLAAGANWPAPLARHVAGHLSREAVLEAASAAPKVEDRNGRLCETHCYVGILAERTGDARAARTSYEVCVATKARGYLEFDYARERLKRLR